MKISTRSTYGLRAAIALAAVYGQRTLMVKEIAEQQNLPATYLEQLMVQLRKAEIVNATRGAHGGYRLARPPQDITALEIVQTFEGTLELVDCSAVPNCCRQPETCALRDLFSEASQALIGVLGGVSLATLLERQRAKEADMALMYSI